jgi:hypothetical protein
MSIKELFENDYLSKCFTFDLEGINTKLSFINSKKKVILTCNRCKEEKEYVIRSLQEKCKHLCSCPTKRLSDNYNEYLISKQSIETVSETEEEELKEFDLTTTIPFNFVMENDHLHRHCCNDILYSSKIIHKINMFDECTICGHKNEKKNNDLDADIEYLRRDFYKNINNEIDKKLEEYDISINKEFINATQLYSFICDDNDCVHEILQNLSEEYIEDQAQFLQDQYDDFIDMSESEIIEIISNEEDLCTIYKKYKEALSESEKIGNNIKALYYYKNKIDVNKIQNVSNTIKRIRKLYNTNLDPEFIQSNSIDAFIYFDIINKDIVDVECNKDNNTIKYSCDKCKSKFTSCKSAFKYICKQSEYGHIHDDENDFKTRCYGCNQDNSLYKDDVKIEDDESFYVNYNFLRKGKY